MTDSQLAFQDTHSLVENEYEVEREATNAALFTVSNGYLGVRGSFEEFGSIRIQGAYVRGLLDQIQEAPQIIPDNLYMKKFYVDEERMKGIVSQECVINFADILLVRISIGGEWFYPWEGKVLSWKRTLDMKTARLIREVRWENSLGDITRLTFERFASFANDHLFCQKITITPENHRKKIEVVSGIDLRTKTAGQRVTTVISSEISGNHLFASILSGDLYKFVFSLGVANRWSADGGAVAPDGGPVDAGGILANRFSVDSEPGTTYVLEKSVYLTTSREEKQPETVTREKLELMRADTYLQHLAAHETAWKDFFGKIDIEICGDDDADRSLRFSNYHTAISLPRNDSVHALAAKGLTGEAYNNFVWWDCEVYQLPVFLHTAPGLAKNMLKYRHEKLPAAREIAAEEGRKGARYPFNSAVTGREVVWQHVRHPNMQVHVTADVAWGVMQYFRITGDRQFMADCGCEMVWEISRYWATRVQYHAEQKRYEINGVTGPDEHHPYLNNNAYTNVLVRMVLEFSSAMYREMPDAAREVMEKIGLSALEVEEWEKIAREMYLPVLEDSGLIPQFDGYFGLSRSLEVAGGSSAKAFQMKESGLYHSSQVIKQPDVMMLFAYLNLDFGKEIYAKNWDYYEDMCEASSSLSYPVHSICASDNQQPEKAYHYFLNSARIDLDDRHHCAWQGIHSACAAGAWYAVVRGVAGIVCRDDRVEIHPHMQSRWESLRFSIVWNGQTLEVHLNQREISLHSAGTNTKEIPIAFRGEISALQPDSSLTFAIGLKASASIKSADFLQA